MRAVRFVFVAFLAAAVGMGLAVATLRMPYKGFKGPEVFVDIPKGTSTAGIAGRLARAGVIRYAWQLLAARALRADARLEAGEYRFAAADTAWNVFGRLARGDVFYYELTVPEGDNVFDIARKVGALGRMKREDMLRAAADASPIRDLDAKAPTLEGYLFPSTYRLTRHTTAGELCRTMTAEFRKEWRSLDPGGASVHDTVTLASMVEKETGNAAERPFVASVFRNRLEKGMALDCDPTAIYAALMDRRYRGAIHRSDLESQNAYNTYRHAGLPPGPIANPGRASLQAALEPANSDYLYFVAKADGTGHRFSRTMAEHNERVKEYRRGLKARGGE